MKRFVLYGVLLLSGALRATQVSDNHALSFADDELLKAVAQEKLPELKKSAHELIATQGQEALTYIAWLGAKALYYLTYAGILHQVYVRKHGQDVASGAALMTSMTDAAHELIQGNELAAATVASTTIHAALGTRHLHKVL